jgi:hypothetical protein
MRFGQHVSLGAITYLGALAPVLAWILYRQGLPVGDLWQNGLNIIILHWWEIGICFLLCLLGSMAPDIDTKSISQKIIYTLLFLADLALILFKYYRESAILGFLAMVPMLVKHRRQLHSYIAAIVIPMPLLFIPIFIVGEMDYRNLGVSYYISALAGFLSHIIADGEGDWN